MNTDVTLDLNTKIRTLKQSNDQVKKELSLYKDKATRILQVSYLDII